MPASAHGAGSTRRVPRALLLVAGALLLARIGTGIYEGRHPPDLPERVEWQPIASADSAARATGKPILYDFTADWCLPCQMMKREVFANERSARTINGMFVPVRVLDRSREDGKNPPEVDKLQVRYKVQAFPTLIVVSPDGGNPEIVSGYLGRRATMQDLLTANAKVRLHGLRPGDASKSGRGAGGR